MKNLRRFLFGLAAVFSSALALVSCREVAEPAAPADDEIEFTVVAGSGATRTTNDGLHTHWAAGDDISVLHCAAGGGTFYSSGFAFIGDNVFRGRVRGLSASNDWYMVYPYRQDNVSAEAVHITVPGAQTQTGNGSMAHLAGESFPLVGLVKAVAQDGTPSVTMNQALAVFQHQVTNTTDAPIVVKSVELTAPVALCGEFEGDITLDSIPWAPTQETSSTAVLSVADGTSIAAGSTASFYVGTAPFTVAAGSTILVKVTAVHPADPDTEIPFYHNIFVSEARTFGPNSIVEVPHNYDEDHQTEDARRTYTYASTLEAGVGLLIGNESNTDAALYRCTFPPVNGTLPEVLYSEDRTITTIVTEDPDFIAHEVELKSSGNGWLVKVKASNQYLYCAGGDAALTSDESLAVHTVSYGSNGCELCCTSGSTNTNYYLYHSGSGHAFKYRTTAGANNLRFFKLGENAHVDPDGETYNLENEAVALYLNRVEAHPYDIVDRSESVVGDYCGAASQSNRLDWPKPVPVSWINPASGNAAKTIYIYNDALYTDLEMTVSAAASDVQANIYNLIPRRTYYYRVMNGDTAVKEGHFSTDGRRRMMKIGSGYGATYANNCRDLGGQIAEDGRMIRYGKIYRGSNMDNTSTEAKNTLLNYMKIGLDVDLRAGGYGGGDNVRKDALNLGNITVYDATDYTGHTQEEYRSDNISVEIGDLTTPQKMCATLTRIMNAAIAGTPVYVHCRIGADRTGFTCMMLEALLGVPLERCEVDYELTSFSSSGLRTRGGSQDGVYFQCSEIVKARSGATFQAKAIDYAVNVLGVSSSLITQFQTAMLENVSE